MHYQTVDRIPFFEFGSDSFSRLVGTFRQQIFEEVAASDLPGLVFTWIWMFDQPSDREFIEEVRSLFAEHGCRTVFVELRADLDTRLARNRTELRLSEKASNRDVEQSEKRLLEAEERYRMSSDEGFPFADHLVIDNSALEPEEVARQIAEHFSLPRL